MYIPDSEYKLILQRMPIICVDLLIMHNNKCLLLKRNNEPAKGQWWFPGGRIYKMELLKNAAIRKSKEETNLDCEFIRIVSVEETIFNKNKNMEHDIHTINVCCELKVKDVLSLKIDKYHDEFLWVDKIDSSFHIAVKKPLSVLGIK